MQRIIKTLFTFATATLVLIGCSKTIVVTIPPKVDLKAYQTIGVLEFSATGQPTLATEATQKFIQSLQAAQPGVPLLELGPMDQVLASVGKRSLDYAAIKAIGKKYGVDALATGHLDISEAKPNVQFNGSLDSLRAGASVKGKMNAKLQVAKNGATIWTNSRHGQWSVANLSLNGGKATSFGFSDPREKYGKIVGELAHAVTSHFRPTYERRKVEE